MHRKKTNSKIDFGLTFNSLNSLHLKRQKECKRTLWIFERNKKDPSIFYYDVELELEEKIAESFDDFISRLYRNPEQPYSANTLFPEDKTTFTYKEGEAVFLEIM